MFSYNGRIRRRDYIIGLLIIYFISLFVDSILKDGLFKLIIGIILLGNMPGLIIRRSHDIGNSGWWVLVPFYPLYLIFKDGDIGPNKYGRDPKYRKKKEESKSDNNK